MRRRDVIPVPSRDVIKRQDQLLRCGVREACGISSRRGPCGRFIRTKLLIRSHRTTQSYMDHAKVPSTMRYLHGGTTAARSVGFFQTERLSQTLGLLHLVLIMNRQEDANYCSASLRLDIAFDGDLSTVPFNKLFRDKNSNSCPSRWPPRKRTHRQVDRICKYGPTARHRSPNRDWSVPNYLARIRGEHAAQAGFGI